MSFMEIDKPSRNGSTTFQWSHYITVSVAIVAVGIGFFLRNQTVSRVALYSNAQAGINVEYPANWLLDSEGDYVLRVRDTAYTGFKTTFQISIRPVSADSSTRNILDALSLERIRTLTSYTPLSLEPFNLGTEIEAQSLTYTYVDRESSPFLEAIPTVVTGFDVLTIQRGQAIIITYRADARIFEQEFPRFQRFLETINL